MNTNDVREALVRVAADARADDDLDLGEVDSHPSCESIKGCDKPAVARFVVVCPCRPMRLGCDQHIEQSAKWFDNALRPECLICGGVATGYRVVPL